MKKNYELLIFDWDGTLMDSESKIINCFQAALRDADIAPIEDDRIRDIIGLGLKESMDVLLPEYDEPIHLKVVESYREHFLFRDKTEMPMFPGVIKGINRLHSQNYKLAIATGKARRGLDRVLTGHELEHLFHVTRCADETVSKPHPMMLQQILEVAKIPAENTLMIGDSIYDLQMASNAGVDALAVSYGVQSCDRLLEYAPIGCIHEFDDLYTWLN